jgi:hypothetical protein
MPIIPYKALTTFTPANASFAERSSVDTSSGFDGCAEFAGGLSGEAIVMQTMMQLLIAYCQ